MNPYAMGGGAAAGLILGGVMQKMKTDQEKKTADQQALTNLYSQFTGKDGGFTHFTPTYTMPLQGMMTGMAMGQQFGGAGGASQGVNVVNDPMNNKAMAVNTLGVPQNTMAPRGAFNPNMYAITA